MPIIASAQANPENGIFAKIPENVPGIPEIAGENRSLAASPKSENCVLLRLNSVYSASKI